MLALTVEEMVESEGRLKAWARGSTSACACGLLLGKLFELRDVRV